MASVDVIARGLAAKGLQEADRANARLDALPNGLVYRGAVDYYQDLPNDAEIGDVYTVKYAGTSGSIPDDNEYAWGTYNGVDQWIKLGKDYESLAAVEGGTDVSLVTTGEKYIWNNKQDALVSGSNIKTINNETILGSGNISIVSYHSFDPSWVTNGTTEEFCTSIVNDASAVAGMTYLGTLRCSDLPGHLSQGEAVVEVISNGVNGKALRITLSSVDTAPYHWEYERAKVNGSYITPGWQAYQLEITNSNKLSSDLVDDTGHTHKFVTASEKTTWDNKQDALTAGTNIQINGTTISATDTTYDIATLTTAGLVKSSTTGSVSGRDYDVEVRVDGTMKVNVPWTDTTYTMATTQDINRLFETEYTITTSVTNGTYTGDISIWSEETASVTVVADPDYELPNEITVTGAAYTYDNVTGVINLNHATDDVVITVVCVGVAADIEGETVVFTNGATIMNKVLSVSGPNAHVTNNTLVIN